MSHVDAPAEQPTATATIPVADYEQRLDEDPRWALSEGSRHFEEKSAVHEALRKICKRLNDLHIPYAVAGGMALFQHGFRRFTEDVDILVTRDALREIHGKLSGLGYRPLFTGSKNLRDAEWGVRIEFLVTGDYPGDGKEKPVAFPHPENVSTECDDIRYLNLPVLVELKLASGMTGLDRMKDLADVQELIKLLGLPLEFADQLDPYVQPKYRELWQAVRGTTRRYVRIWKTAAPAADLNTIEELVASDQQGAETLRQMRDDGVTLERGTANDIVHLVTTDPEVAKKHDMHEESEFWDKGETTAE